jgi:hypothetical protein
MFWIEMIFINKGIFSADIKKLVGTGMLVMIIYIFWSSLLIKR